MAIGLINFSITRTLSGWARVFIDATSDAPVPNTSWTTNYRDGYLPDSGENNTSASHEANTGDAAWVVEVSSRESHYKSGDTAWAILDVWGMTPDQAVKVTCFSRTIFDRKTRWRVNGGVSQDLEPYDPIEETANTSEVVTFDAVVPSNGILSIEYQAAPGYMSGRATAVKIEEIAGPEATLDDAALEPGKAITGTYANYTSAPTVLTLTDSEGNTVSSASEITDLVIDDSAETYAFTMPDRITTGTGTTLLRGDITVELT